MWLYYRESPWTRDGRAHRDIVSIATDVSGLVSEVAVRSNERVDKGQLLFRIDPQRTTLALRQAQAVVTSRKAACDEAHREADRYSSLSSAVISQQKQDNARSTDEQAEAAYQKARANRDMATLNLAHTVVTAPANGIASNPLTSDG